MTSATAKSILPVLFRLLGLMFPAASISTTTLLMHHDSFAKDRPQGAGCCVLFGRWRIDRCRPSNFS